MQSAHTHSGQRGFFQIIRVEQIVQIKGRRFDYIHTLIQQFQILSHIPQSFIQITALEILPFTILVEDVDEFDELVRTVQSFQSVVLGFHTVHAPVPVERNGHILLSTFKVMR